MGPRIKSEVEEMSERVIYRFLWQPHAIGFGKPRKWLAFKGIVQEYRDAVCKETGGYDLFGYKSYYFTGGYWSDRRWYNSAVNEPKLTAGAVIKGLLWSGFTLSLFLLLVLVGGRIAWVVLPEFWEAISWLGIGTFNFLFGWLF